MKTNELNMPIYRGKKIDSDEYVKGFYAHFDRLTDVGFSIEVYSHCIISKDGMYTDMIDPSTLEMSFDDGVTWDWIEHVKTVMFLHHEEEE